MKVTCDTSREQIVRTGTNENVPFSFFITLLRTIKHLCTHETGSETCHPRVAFRIRIAHTVAGSHVVLALCTWGQALELISILRKLREKLCASELDPSKNRRNGTNTGRLKLRCPLCVRVFRVLEGWNMVEVARTLLFSRFSQNSHFFCLLFPTIISIRPISAATASPLTFLSRRSEGKVPAPY